MTVRHLWASAVGRLPSNSGDADPARYCNSVSSCFTECTRSKDGVPTSSSECCDARPSRSSEYGEVVNIVSMSRITLEYREALQTSRDLEPVRWELQQCGHKWFLDPPGAYIFVNPDQYHAMLTILNRLELRPHHVVIAASLMPLLEQAIGALPSKRHIRVRTVQLAALMSDDASSEMLVVERTFFRQITPRRLEAVTQSTSGARCKGNPRCGLNR